MAKKDLDIKNSLATPKETGAYNLFNYKKAYKNIDSVVISGIETIDFQDIRQSYGKLDLDGRAVYPSEENLITLNSESSSQPVFIVNFVGDAFTDLRAYMRRAAFRKKVDINNSPMFDLDPVAGWRSFKKDYHDYLNEIYLLFFNKYIRQNKINEKINNFDDFVEAFLPFVRSYITQFNMPFTFSGFIKHQMCSPMIGGLMIDISSADCNNDLIKRKEFLQNADFEFYRNTVKKFGFVVDKNIPWRLVADLSSNPMKKYMDEYGLKYKQVFPEYYYRAINYDVGFFKDYMVGFYNSLVTSIPYVNQTEYCAAKIKTISRLSKRLPILKEDLDKNYSLDYWLNKYILFRTYETKSKLEENDLKLAEKKLRRMVRKFDISKIMLYIDSIIENNTGLEKHMFKQEEWPDFDYTPPPPKEFTNVQGLIKENLGLGAGQPGASALLGLNASTSGDESGGSSY